MESSSLPVRPMPLSRLVAAIVGIVIMLAPLPAAAQSAAEAQNALRLQQLEDQVRTLTGQVEGLQFQLAQMQTLVQKLTSDYDARLTQLESARPAAQPPQQPVDTGPAIQPPAGQQGSVQQLETHGGITAPVLGPDQQPMDGGADDGQPQLPPGGLNIDSSGPDVANIGGNNATEANSADAQAQYAAGYDAVVKSDYPFAEDQFKQFLDLYPDSPQAPDATVWLGEAMIQAGDYDDAAEALIAGYQKFRDSLRAPDMLLKLGTALNGAGQRDTACRTFSEIPKRYSNLTDAFNTRLSQEQAKAQCPPA